MGVLVDDLLLLARLDANTDAERALDREPVDLEVLAGDAVTDLRAVDPTRPVSLDAEHVTVVGDESRLRQVIANLLNNARQHTPPGTAVHVRVARDVVTGGAILDVVDDGPGIPDDLASHVFERFWRADAARGRAQGGAGLGLSIVAAVVEAHGGTVTVESPSGSGARFRVTMPPGGPETAPNQLPPAARPVTSPR